MPSTARLSSRSVASFHGRSPMWCSNERSSLPAVKLRNVASSTTAPVRPRDGPHRRPELGQFLPGGYLHLEAWRGEPHSMQYQLSEHKGHDIALRLIQLWHALDSHHQRRDSHRPFAHAVVLPDPELAGRERLRLVPHGMQLP